MLAENVAEVEILSLICEGLLIAGGLEFGNKLQCFLIFVWKLVFLNPQTEVLAQEVSACRDYDQLAGMMPV